MIKYNDKFLLTSYIYSANSLVFVIIIIYNDLISFSILYKLPIRKHAVLPVPELDCIIQFLFFINCGIPTFCILDGKACLPAIPHCDKQQDLICL